MSAIRPTALLRSSVLRSAPRAVKPMASLRRSFADQAPKQSASSTPYVLGGLALAAAGAGYFFFGTEGTPEEQARLVETKVKQAGAIAEAQTGLKRGKADYERVYQKIADILDVEGYDDGSYGPVLVRLAWHASGTYDKETKTGGSNYATMRFEPESLHGANNGLNKARDVLEKIKQEEPWISYGDLWTLAGVAAIQEMGGPKIPWRPGRIDGFAHHVTPDGRLPDASQEHDHLRTIFYRMGFNDQEIVALSGAHALGRCHTDRSGFDGPWTFSPVTFSNEYFKLLFDEKWVWRDWKGPKQMTDKKTKSLMMLPTDMALAKDKSFRKTAIAYAKDEDLFFKDFSAVFSKLIELGVPTAQFPGEAWTMEGTGSN